MSIGRSHVPGPAASIEARRRLRLLREALDDRVKALSDAAASIPASTLRDVHFRTSRRRDQAMQAILRTMGERPMLQERRGAMWRLFRPIDGQIVVEALTFGLESAGFTQREFALGFNDHAILRLMDRTSFQIDPVLAMATAHSALLTLDPQEGRQMFELRDIRLPTECGMFLSTVRQATSADDGPFTTARTWVGIDQMHDDQTEDLHAWERLLDAPTLTGRFDKSRHCNR